MLLILAGIILELAFYVLIRQIVAAYEKLFIWRGKRGVLHRKLCSASDYEKYMQYAHQIDIQSGINLRERDAQSRYYDAPLLLRITASLRSARHQDGRAAVVTLCDLLRQGALKANAGGWENREIWARAYSGTTRIVGDYIAEVVASINCVRESTLLSPSEKLAFFRHVARQQGRTALCLSGGAAMGWKHLGVARCLVDEARLPRVISGTSSGSLVAALLGTHTDDELRQVIRPELAKYMTACQGSDRGKFLRWLTKGHYFDAIEWAPRAQVFTRGDMTFREAFERTGKILNIACTPIGHKYSPPKLMNYISTPDVLIWSAVLASACLPGVLPPMVLLMKTRDGTIRPYTGSGVQWRDGSFRNDIPSADLRETLNVQFTVVSQVNPHITLFFYDRDGSIGQPPARRYSSIWRGGFILSAVEHALKLDIRKWMRLLCDLNLVPLLFNQDWTYIWLQKFDGNITILPKSTLSEYFSLLKDPTKESLTSSMNAGLVATWPKLKMIKTRQVIEDAITAGNKQHTR
ncbi:patatin-domain-containing protein [Martensiomyces pterosporus]|nr:patatin-domain-containing protein [Martensiomyces pterosporus]